MMPGGLDDDPHLHGLPTREDVYRKWLGAMDEIRRLKRVLECRAGRLLLKGVPFFVVKASEPYAAQVVALIKGNEGEKWTAEDEAWAQAALAKSGSRDPMDEEAIRWLQKVATESKHGIDSSKIFLGLWSKDIEEDPIPVLQIGYALISGKPMSFLVPDDVPLPPKVKAIADGIAIYKRGDDESFKAASLELLAQAEGDGRRQSGADREPVKRPEGTPRPGIGDSREGSTPSSAPPAAKECERCGGDGKGPYTESEADKEFFDEFPHMRSVAEKERSCPDCGGTGKRVAGGGAE